MPLSESEILDLFVHQQLAQSGDAWTVISRMDNSIVMGRKKESVTSLAPASEHHFGWPMGHHLDNHGDCEERRATDR